MSKIYTVIRSIKLFLWMYFAKNIPGYWIRKKLFRFLLENQICENSALHRGLDVVCLGGIRIGENSTINRHVSIDGRGGVEIGNRVCIAPFVVVITGSHDYNSPDFKYVQKPVVIEDYAWIGTGAIILPGVRIKKGGVVGAGSVVTKDVEPFTFVAGNPARYIKGRERELNYDPSWEPFLQ